MTLRNKGRNELFKEEHNALLHGLECTAPGRVDRSKSNRGTVIDRPTRCIKTKSVAVAVSFYIETVTRHSFFYFCANTFPFLYLAQHATRRDIAKDQQCALSLLII